MDENNKENVMNNIYQNADASNFYNPNVSYHSDSYFDS